MEKIYYRDDNLSDELAYITGAPAKTSSGERPKKIWGQVRVFLNLYDAIDHRQHVRALETGYKPRAVGWAVRYIEKAGRSGSGWCLALLSLAVN
jgi:hypothetical protein